MSMIKPSRLRPCITAIAALCMVGTPLVRAQNTITIDATTASPAPTPVAAPLGSAQSPNGDTIGVNSQYLTFNQKPWLPVMGEFHFSRYPQAQWEQEILKMKAAGVTIISTYIIWIHHEQTEGVFDWSGQRDLRTFVQLCGKHGLYVWARIGPWAHAEVRNGGLPDWVLHNSPTRQNNPIYLREVDTLYAQIAEQLKGSLWKDGGPVIGIQLENEYGSRGPGKGEDHIRTLKKMAIEHGLDVPLYTVTGWDGAAIPLDSVLPVFGGYPDAPWDGSSGKLPPSEIYSFRFSNRSAGSMGAIGGQGQSPASVYRGTPFLTAEVGGGGQDTYFRRPVLSSDDIASIAPIMLGSGVNMLGFYMFHGGRNPDGGSIPLQESQRTGYPSDLPEKSYDFQAPLGEFGQERPSLRKLKLIDYFLNDFGENLAPMQVRQPSTVPANPSDFSVPRISARTAGNSGFLFFNNHVRNAQMPSRPGFQINLRLPAGKMQIPAAPITLPSDAYGIWPINLDLHGTNLRYSTAQLFKRLTTHGQTYFFFFAIDGIDPEFLFAPTTPLHTESGAITQTSTSTGLIVRATAPAELQLPNATHIILLPLTRAEDLWRVDDPTQLLETSADAFSNGPTWTLQSTQTNDISFAIFPKTAPTPTSTTPLTPPLTPTTPDPLFTHYLAHTAPIHLQTEITKTRAASPRAPFENGPVPSWRKNPIPIAPDAKDFSAAAVWSLTLPPIPPDATLSDVLLRIHYQGDVARLNANNQLIDDNFWNGLPFDLGLHELGGRDWRTAFQHLQLQILALPQTAPMVIEAAPELHFTAGQALQLTGVTLVPQYQVILHQTPSP
jgi:beta-galactosidase